MDNSFFYEPQAYKLNPSVAVYFGLPEGKEKIIEVLDK